MSAATISIRPPNPMKQLMIEVETDNDLDAWAWDRAMKLATHDFGGFHQHHWPANGCNPIRCEEHGGILSACPGRSTAGS